MTIRHNRVKVNANGTDANTDFTLGAAVPSFRAFTSGSTYYTALAETGEWQVGYGSVLNGVLTRGTVEENHIGTTSQIDFTGKVLQIAKTTTADYLDDITTKLDTIEDNATADMTGAEIKVAYEAEPDTNVFDDSAEAKLASLQTGAAPDQTGAEIKVLYETEADTNAFDDAAQAKLLGIEELSQVNPTGAEIKVLYEAEPDTNAFDTVAQTKLLGIADNATVDQIAITVPFTPTATVLSTDVQLALQEIDTLARTGLKDASTVAYDPTDDVLVVETNVQDALVIHADHIENKLFPSTGLVTGGKLSATLGTSLFNIAAGTGLFSYIYRDGNDDVVPLNSTWNTLPSISISPEADGLSAVSIRVGLDYSSGSATVIKLVGELGNTFIKDYILLGTIHAVNGSITGVTNSPIVAKQAEVTINELVQRATKITGTAIYGTDTGLSIWQEAGKIYSSGVNWQDTTHINPNEFSYGAIGSTISPMLFNVIKSTGELVYTDATVVPVEYDAAGVVTALPSTKATIHRVYSLGLLEAQRKTFILLGENLYDSADLAKDNVYTETVTLPTEIDSLTQVGFISVTAESTSFNSSDTWIISDTASITSGASGGTGVGFGDITGITQDNSSLDNRFTTVETGLTNKEPTISPKLTAFNKGFGTATDTVCEGNDTRLGNTKSELILTDVTGSEPAYAAGQVYYANNLFNMHDDVAEATMNIGHELWVKAYNATASTIANGSMVKIIGTENGKPSIDLAQAIDFDSASVLGIATHDIETLTVGNVTTYGNVSEVPVNQDGETWLVGDFIYLSAVTPGGMTNVLPPIGTVAGVLLTSNGVTGILLCKTRSLISLPSVGGWMKLIANTINPTGIPTDFTNFGDVSTSAALVADGVAGTYTFQQPGTYEISLSVSFSGMTPQNSGSILLIELYNLTTATVLFGYNIIVGRDDTVASGTFVTQDDFVVGNQIVARFSEVSGGTGTAVNVDSISFIVKSVLIR